jgi:flagellar protein FlaD
MEANKGKESEKKDDNRNVIKLEELKEESSEEEKYLEDSDIKALIYAERGLIPSVILDELYDSLKGRRVSKKQLKRIISKVKENLDTESKIEKIDDLYKKLDALEKLLKNFGSPQPKSQDVEAEEIILGAETNKQVFDKPFDRLSGEPEKIEAYDSEMTKEVRVDGGVEMEAAESLEKGDGKQTDGLKLKMLPTDSKRIIFLLKWIEYLVERVGYEELENALDYYVDIGWISEEVLFTILRYAKGIKLYHEKSDWRPVGYLNVQDHIMSLMFIEALRTGKFSRETIMEVEREVFRMKREAMELNGI